VLRDTYPTNPQRAARHHLNKVVAARVGDDIRNVLPLLVGIGSVPSPEGLADEVKIRLALNPSIYLLPECLKPLSNVVERSGKSFHLPCMFFKPLRLKLVGAQAALFRLKADGRAKEAAYPRNAPEGCQRELFKNSPTPRGRSLGKLGSNDF
jgi:hypothetical protein